MIYDFDQIIERRASDSIKWNAYPEDVLPMWVADMDFRSPEPVIQRLIQRVQHGVFGYPTGLSNKPNDTAPLREAIVDWVKRRHGWEIQPDDIFLVPGVVAAFNLVTHALCAENQAVLVQTPVYPPIAHVGKETGLLQQEMLLDRQADGSYTIDWDRFEAAITPQTHMFLLCNPHNPVGKVFTRAELAQMAEICLRHGVTICSDEIHADLIYSEHKHTPIASLDPEIARNTITLMAPSKTFNLAGLESSFAIIQNPELRQRVLAARRGLMAWVNLMGLEATLAAYQEGEDWLDQLLVYLEGNRNTLVDFVQHCLPGVHMGIPQGTYLAWLDCREAGLPGNPYKFFLENAKVGLNDGETFGNGGQGFVRLNFGCPRAVLQEGLARLEAALHRARVA